MQNFEYYEPRLIIDEHFAKLINHIDVKTEQLLANPNLSEDDKNELNLSRAKQIAKLEEIKQINLAANKLDLEPFLAKWDSLLNDPAIEYETKLDVIKRDLIVQDCVLVNDHRFKSTMALWLFRWFNDQQQLNLLQ